MNDTKINANLNKNDFNVVPGANSNNVLNVNHGTNSNNNPGSALESQTLSNIAEGNIDVSSSQTAAIGIKYTLNVSSIGQFSLQYFVHCTYFSFVPFPGGAC